MKRIYSAGFGLTKYYNFSFLFFFFFCISIAQGQGIASPRSISALQKIASLPFAGKSDSPQSSTTACQNSDFSGGDFAHWSGCSGLWCNDQDAYTTRCYPGAYTPFNPACNNPGQPWYNVPMGGHFSIETPGSDPCISQLQKVFPGDAYSALIGARACNDGQGGYVDQLTYQIAYDSNNSFFIYRCAVVLSNITNPTHNTADKRPRFTFSIVDHETGDPVDPVCGFYDLWPGDDITVWQNGPNNYVWKDWSTIGIDFKALTGVRQGQILDVIFTVHGCAFTAHTGYAYISAVCGSMNIQVAGCEGSGSVTLTGPPGFTSYEWIGPYCPSCPPDPPIYYGNPITLDASQGAVTGNVFVLNLTALNGCQVQNVQQIIAFTSVTAAFTNGQACVNQGVQFTDQSTCSQNTITAWDWDFGDASTIQHEKDPVHTFTAAGTYTITLTAYSSDGCPATTTGSVTVDPVPVPTLNGENEVCVNSTGKVYTTEAGKVDYLWTIPPQATVTGGGTISDNTVTLTWNTVGSYSIGVNYSNPVTLCTAASPTTFAVIVNTPPVPSFTAGESSVCLNIPGKVYTTQAGQSNYVWTIPPQATVTAGGTATDNSVTLTWNTIGNYSISISYTDPVTQCAALAPTPYPVTVNPLPSPSFTAGENTVCLNIPGKVYTTEAGKSNYIWTIPPQATVTAGGTTSDNSVTLTWNTTGSYSISVNYTDPVTQCTAPSATSYAVTVNPLPAPIFTAGESPVCLNIPGKVYITDAGKSNYIWTIPPQATVTGGGTINDNSVTLTWNTAGSYSISVNYTDPLTLCTAVAATPYSVTVDPLPSPSFTAGEPSICLDIPGKVYTTQPGKLNYIWTIPPQASITGGGTVNDNSVTLTGNTAGSYSISVNYTDPVTLCTAVAPAPFAVIVNPLPSPTFTAGESSVCLNIPGKVYTTQPGQSNYIWTIPPQATVTAGGTVSDNTVTLTWNTTGNYSVAVNYTDPVSLCTAPASTSYSVTVNPLPVPTFTAGENNVCLNVPGKVYTTQAGQSNYIWTIPAEATVTAGGTTADNSVTLTWNTTGSYILSVNYTDPVTVCTAALATSYSVTVHPLPTPSFTAGAGSVCLNIPGKVYTTQAGKTNYVWTIPPQATVTAGGTATDNSVTLTWITAGSYSISVNYADPATLCTAAVPTPYAVTVHPLPVPSFTSGENPVCFNIPGKVYSTQAAYSNYIWTIPPQAVVTAGGTVNDNSVTLTWVSTGSYSLGVNYTDPATLCTAPAATQFPVTVNLLSTPSFTAGENNVCLNVPGKTYTTQPGKLNYVWTIPPQATVTAGGTTADNSVTLTWNTVGSYTISIDYTDPGTGCASSGAVPYSVAVHPLPTPTFTSGENNVCSNTPGKVYTTQAGKSNYIWTIPPEATVTGGGATTDNSVTLTWITAGNYSISVNYADPVTLCTAVLPTTFAVTVNPLPVTTITSAPGPDCNLQQHIYSVPPDPSCTFTWSLIPAGRGNVSAGQGTDQVTISWLNYGPATISVTGINSPSGCTSSSSFPTTVHPSPVSSFISCFDAVTTKNARPFQLKGGLPLLGQYLGSAGITYDALTLQYWFDPSLPAVAPGIHQIFYSYQNIYGCSNSTPAVSINVLSSNFAFNCGTVFTDPRNPDPATNNYPTTLITGNGRSRCWMMRNLNWGATLAASQPQTDNCVVERYCSPATDPNCTSVGGLYQWDELIQYGNTSAPDYQGICPPGWHIPSQQDWQDLIDASAAPVNPGDGLAGGFLKDPNPAVGFHVLLDGIYYLNNTWAFTNGSLTATMFWTSTTSGTSRAVARGLNNFNPSVSLYASSRANALPVRCVKD